MKQIDDYTFICETKEDETYIKDAISDRSIVGTLLQHDMAAYFFKNPNIRVCCVTDMEFEYTKKYIILPLSGWAVYFL